MKLKRMFAISVFGLVLSLNLIGGAFAESENKEVSKISKTVNVNKPIVAVVKAEWCSTCKRIGPVVMELMKEYDKTAQFVVLDVTNAKTSKEAEKTAKKFGISKFFKENKSQTGSVTIISPQSKEVLKTFQGEGDKKAYEVALNEAINR